MKKHSPPKWADRFLSWYCRADLLEEIQGDVYELYYRIVKENKLKADLVFIWNVCRFFRFRNIKHLNSNISDSTITTAMIKNNIILLLRGFKHNPGHSLITFAGLIIAFISAFLILLWAENEASYDQFHADAQRIFKVITHENNTESIETYFTAGYNIDVSSVPEIETITHISTGTRWPHELCFRPEAEPNECRFFNGVYSSPNLFTTFSFPMISGELNPTNNTNQIAISQRMAEALYGSDTAIGKIIQIDGSEKKAVVVAAVFENTPSQSTLQFDFVLPFDILMKQWGIDEENMQSHFFEVYAKTSSDIAATRLTEKLNSATVIGEKHRSDLLSYEAFPFTEWHLNSSFENGQNVGGRILYFKLFLVAGILVVLMAVINFVNLTTARASLRGKEIGVRKAIGASQNMLIIQFLVESFIILFLSFLVALAATLLIMPYFSQLVGVELNIQDIELKSIAYLFTFLLVISLLAGIYPAFIMSGYQPSKVLKGESARLTTGSLNVRKSLMVIQLTLSICIILFSFVVFFQIDFIQKKNLGFDRENMIRLEPTFAIMKSFDVFKDEVLKSGIIEGVSASDANPMDLQGGSTHVEWQGKDADNQVFFQMIGSQFDFPELFGLNVIEGRDFLAKPQVQDSLLTEAIITETAARAMGFEDPIGQKIKLHGYLDCEIVGVVNDFHTSSLKEPLKPVILYQKHIYQTPQFYIKYKPGKVNEAIASLNEAYKSVDPNYTMRYWFQDETFDNLYVNETLAAKLNLAFCIVSFVIATIGILGLATFNSARKTKELGVRKVFGASTPQILLVLAQEFIWVFVISLAFAVPVAWIVASNWLQNYAFKIPFPWDVFGYTTVGILFIILAIIWIQGNKVILRSPTTSLRSD